MRKNFFNLGAKGATTVVALCSLDNFLSLYVELKNDIDTTYVIIMQLVESLYYRLHTQIFARKHRL